MNQPVFRLQSGSQLAIGKTNWQAAVAGFAFFVVSQVIITNRFATLLHRPGFHLPGAWFFWLILGALHPDPRIQMADLYTTFAAVPITLLISVAITKQVTATRNRSFNEGSEDLHGSARFATETEIRNSQFAKARTGPYIGAWEPEPGRLEYLRDDSDEHIVATAPSGTGKSAGLVIPTLLDCPDHSMFVLDPKGSLHRLTSGYRAQHGDVYRFAPCEEESSRYNLFGEVRIFTKRDVPDAQNIAQLTCKVPGISSKDPHWDNIAASLVTGLILHASYKAAAQGREATGHEIALLLTPVATKKIKVQQVDEKGTLLFHPLTQEPLLKEVEEPLTFVDTLAEMCSFEHDPEGKHGGWSIRDQDGREIPTLTHPVVKEKAMEMLNRITTTGPNDEFSGALSSAKERFELYSDELIQGATSCSDFAIDDLVNGERPATLYFVLPLSDQERLIPLARTIVTRFFNRLTEQQRIAKPNRWPFLWMLEEFPIFEEMEIFDKRLPLVREYRLRCFLIAQSDKQITKHYGQYNSVYNNCGRQIAYAPNDNETARMISDMTGSRTVQNTSSSFSGKMTRISAENVQTHIAHVQRPLMTPEEVRRLEPPAKQGRDVIAPGASLIFANGCRPIFGRQMLFFFDPEFRRRAALPEVTEWPRKH